MKSLMLVAMVLSLGLTSSSQTGSVNLSAGYGSKSPVARLEGEVTVNRISAGLGGLVMASNKQPAFLFIRGGYKLGGDNFSLTPYVGPTYRIKNVENRDFDFRLMFGAQAEGEIIPEMKWFFDYTYVPEHSLSKSKHFDKDYQYSPSRYSAVSFGVKIKFLDN